ncbi:MAG: hypothetical protein EAY68_06495, partial [Bacteroidetes bacterium]
PKAKKIMEKELLAEYISPASNAKVLVLFGGNPHRRDEVIRQMMTLPHVSIYGTLSEEEGIEKLKNLPKVDLVLIGGRYDDTQRVRIRTFVKTNLPHTPITEPGYDYPYENAAILNEVKQKLNL